ncbi:SPOR domain-containing protein [Limibacillus sp. MBR-115]|uniref:SPOR domain-containing protein n=1 Tax=Limibacillus sp. MBR-115 TaxID=3156465 RepID=UPI003399D2B6
MSDIPDQIPRFLDIRPSPAEKEWMRGGLKQPGGKLLLFDEEDEPIDPTIVRRCLDQLWVEPWQVGDQKPHSVFLACRLTPLGRRLITDERDLAPGVVGSVSGVSGEPKSAAEREKSSRMLLEALEVMYRRERSGWPELSRVRRPVILGSVLVSLLALFIVTWQTSKLFRSPEPSISSPAADGTPLLSGAQAPPAASPPLSDTLDQETLSSPPAEAALIEPSETDVASPPKEGAADTATEVSLIPLSGIKELDKALDAPDVGGKSMAPMVEPSVQADSSNPIRLAPSTVATEVPATPESTPEAVTPEAVTPEAVTPEATPEVASLDAAALQQEEAEPQPLNVEKQNGETASVESAGATTAVSAQPTTTVAAPGTFSVGQLKGPLIGESMSKPISVEAVETPRPKVMVEVAVLPVEKPVLPVSIAQPPAPEAQAIKPLTEAPPLQPSKPAAGAQVAKIEKTEVPATASMVQSGGYKIQFGAFRVKEGAMKFHAQISDSYRAYLDGAGVALEPITAPDDNGLHMVRSGLIVRRSDAIALCQKIKNGGDDCFVFASKPAR